MSIDLHVYGSTDPIYFKLVDSSGNGVSNTLAIGDVTLSKDGGAAANVGVTGGSALPTEVSGMTGVYAWTPTASEVQCKVFALNIVDQTTTKAFIDNCVIVSTGGNASARFSG